MKIELRQATESDVAVVRLTDQIVQARADWLALTDPQRRDLSDLCRDHVPRTLRTGRWLRRREMVVVLQGSGSRVFSDRGDHWIPTERGIRAASYGARYDEGSVVGDGQRSDAPRALWVPKSVDELRRLVESCIRDAALQLSRDLRAGLSVETSKAYAWHQLVAGLSVAIGKDLQWANRHTRGDVEITSAQIVALWNRLTASQRRELDRAVDDLDAAYKQGHLIALIGGPRWVPFRKLEQLGLVREQSQCSVRTELGRKVHSYGMTQPASAARGRR